MKTSLALFSLIGLITLISGIYRHDVPESTYTDLAKQTHFDCVGMVKQDSTLLGSCVLISKNYILSAAHILIEESGQKTLPEKTISISLNGRQYQVKRFIFHPSYKFRFEDAYDLVIMELETAAGNVTPASLNTQFNELNSTVIGVGFGASGKANQPEHVALKQLKIAGENTIDLLSGKKVKGKKSIFLSDFDHPTDESCNKMGSSVPLALEYICSGGDSGGGLFRWKNGQTELIGICSGADADLKTLLKTGYYGQIMKWTRVSAYQDWIKEIIG